MADRPESGDESALPPEVTIPPWLRSGPTPDQSRSSPQAADRSTTEESRADLRPVGEGAPTSGSPHRITLGARSVQASPAEAPDESDWSPRQHDDLSTLPLRSSRGSEYDAEQGSDQTRQGLRTGDAPADALGEPDASQGPADPDGRKSPARIAPSDETTPPAGPPAPATPAEQPARESPSSVDTASAGRGRRIALFAAAGVAIIAGSGVLGYLLVRGVAAGQIDEVAECQELEQSGRIVGSGPGSLDTPAGAVLAFDHAYYVDKSVAKAWDAVSPSSRMSEEQLRAEGVEQIPDGTTHCVEIEEISPTLLDVALTEYPPEAEPVEILQRIRMAENPDGTWGIVSITPAG